jgi:hypothetical protein
MSATATIAVEPQHMQALELANRVRLARAALKRRVGKGDVSAAEVVVECPWEAESMAICDLVMSQRRWGRTRCRKLLTSVSVPERKEIGALTERQRRDLVRALSGEWHALSERAGLPPLVHA